MDSYYIYILLFTINGISITAGSLNSNFEDVSKDTDETNEKSTYSYDELVSLVSRYSIDAAKYSISRYSIDAAKYSTDAAKYSIDAAKYSTDAAKYFSQ